MLAPPVIEQHGHILVVRDDLIAGGTKRRFLSKLIKPDTRELVYASPAYGGAQIAIAHAAREAGIKATIFVAQRRIMHARTSEAEQAGAFIRQVPHGYMSVVKARAKEYASQFGATLPPFGLDLPEAIAAISEVAAEVLSRAGKIDEVWCAAGSGVLCRGLRAGMPGPDFHAVQVGHKLTKDDVAGATIHVYPAPFERESKVLAPFPSCSNYDRKAWEVCLAEATGRALFWNVMK